MSKLIALDDGHGMTTPGKRTPILPGTKTFMHENEFNRAVVNYLKDHLIRCGFKVLLVADGDTDIPLKTRTDRANKANADLYISVHANAMTGAWGAHNGVETYHYPTSTKGKKAAEIIHKHLLKGTKQRDRGVKIANFHVLRETKMPAVLVECGFMDNLDEAKLLMSDAFRRECAEEIARGICEYFNVPYSKPSDKPSQSLSVSEFDKAIDILGEKYGIDTAYWKQKENIDPYFADLIKKIAEVESSGFKYSKQYVTHVIELDPLNLRAELLSGKRPNRENFVNANFFSGSATIGWLISEGKVLNDRHEYKSWKGNYKGTFIVYKDGAVDVGLKLDSEIVAVLDEIWFCCQGFNLAPLDIKKEGFNPAEVGRKSNRVGIGYNGTTGKAVIAVRPDTDAQTMVTVMNNIGCHQSISLDSGGSTNLTVNGKDIFKTDRKLTNIIYWG